MENKDCAAMTDLELEAVCAGKAAAGKRQAKSGEVAFADATGSGRAAPTCSNGKCGV